MAALAFEVLVICAAVVRTGVTSVSLNMPGTAEWYKIQLPWLATLLPLQVVILVPLLRPISHRRRQWVIKAAKVAMVLLGIVDLLLLCFVLLLLLLYFFPPFG